MSYRKLKLISPKDLHELATSPGLSLVGCAIRLKYSVGGNYVTNDYQIKWIENYRIFHLTDKFSLVVRKFGETYGEPLLDGFSDTISVSEIYIEDVGE